MQHVDSKKLILIAAGKVLKKLRKNKSNYLLGAEYSISTSLLSNLERGLKDPQLTTVFKLAQALGVSASEFVNEIEKNLPKEFSMFNE